MTGATRSSTRRGAGHRLPGRGECAWEEAADTGRGPSGSEPCIRALGIVLARDGGALAKMLPPFELGAGGKIGPGSQWTSWVARDDVMRAIELILDTVAIAGPANVAPQPVPNAEFAHTLAHVLHRPAVATIPAFALRLLYGELADAALLASQRAMPRLLEQAGFAFAYPSCARRRPATRVAPGLSRDLSGRLPLTARPARYSFLDASRRIRFPPSVGTRVDLRERRSPRRRPGRAPAFGGR